MTDEKRTPSRSSKASPRFLSGQSILVEIRDALRLSNSADLGIAYWGAGAVQALGLANARGQIRVLCDAYSGACNPHVLRELLELKHVQVRTLERLHAKVVVTSSALIVGSANASANGLGQEGKDAGNLEAAALIREVDCVQQAKKWFGAMWNRAEKGEVTQDTLDEILPLWKARREKRPMKKTGTQSLLSAVLANPGDFRERGIRLIAYEGTDASEEAWATYRRKCNDRYEASELRRYEADEVGPFYEDDGNWNLSGGEYLIDFNINRATRKADYGGLWQVRKNRPFIKTPSGSRIILCDEVTDFQKYRLSVSDVERLGRWVYSFVSRGGFKPNENLNLLDIPLDEVVSIVSPGKITNKSSRYR